MIENRDVSISNTNICISVRGISISIIDICISIKDICNSKNYKYLYLLKEISVTIHDSASFEGRFDRVEYTWSGFCWSYIFNLSQNKKGHFSQIKTRFVSD